MTFSKYYLEQKIAWVNPQFLTSQLEEAYAKRSFRVEATAIESSVENQAQLKQQRAQ